MKKQIVKVIYYGQWKVIHDDSKSVNPYRILLNGKKVIDYADLTSCLYHLSQVVEPRARMCGG